MTALWCAIGYRVVSNHLVGVRARRVAQVVLPFVLIGPAEP